MDSIQQWLSHLLVKWGIISDTASHVDNIIILGVIILLAFLVDYICRYFFLNALRRIARKTKNEWDDLIVDRKVINKLMHIIPAVLIYALLPIAFPQSGYAEILDFLLRMCMIYIIAVSLRFINASLTLLHEVYSMQDKKGNKSIKGFVQIIQVALWFIGAIIVIGILINKSPTTLFAGLGASAAILTLVFKDTIVGFVAGIQLSANDMLRPGDWITMDKYAADGTVIDVTLHAIKVRNFDKTITTIPPYALVNDSFQNWRGMFDSGGRRVKRSVFIDMNSVKFCTPEMLEKFRKISLLSDYLNNKEKELNEYNETHHIDSSVWVNGRRQTNLGVFRAYLASYLKHHPHVHREFYCMVRHLQPTEKGIPIELYFFSTITDWVTYEGIQADVFDHVLAVIPEFELSVFQNVSGSDLRQIGKELIRREIG
ncbi:MAG: mechanosensitive ion channel family protein [Tannerellaceae bacterium]|nr:mechanosensitive ion channel family protein [Tannerellaceae bacterium]